MTNSEAKATYTVRFKVDNSAALSNVSWKEARKFSDAYRKDGRTDATNLTYIEKVAK